MRRTLRFQSFLLGGMVTRKSSTLYSFSLFFFPAFTVYFYSLFLFLRFSVLRRRKITGDWPTEISVEAIACSLPATAIYFSLFIFLSVRDHRILESATGEEEIRFCVFSSCSLLLIKRLNFFPFFCIIRNYFWELTSFNKPCFCFRERCRRTSLVQTNPETAEESLSSQKSGTILLHGI